MTIPVFIDNNVWDFVFEKSLDLCAELPRDQFSIYITREGELEIEGVGPELKAFIEDTIARCGVQTDALFGFDEDGTPPEKRRYRGFGEGGRWGHEEEG